MISATALRGILRADALRIVRDRFVLGLSLYLIGISLAVPWALPWINGQLLERLEFDLSPYYPLLVGHILAVLAPQLISLVGGFMLLESRENGAIRAIGVSPVPLSAYAGALGGVMVIAGTALIAIEAALIGIALPPWPALLAAGFVASLSGPIGAYYIAAFAENKVEAFAYTKFLSSAALIPLGAYFAPEPWQHLAGLYPPFWACKVYWVAQAGEGGWWIWALGGIAVSALWWWAMDRKLQRAIRR